jgi:hypothetical protein
MRCGVVLEYHVANVLGDGEVDPGHNAVINLRPINVVEPSLGIECDVNVIHDAELVEGEFVGI